MADEPDAYKGAGRGDGDQARERAVMIIGRSGFFCMTHDMNVELRIAVAAAVLCIY